MITQAVPILIGAIEGLKSDPIPWTKRFLRGALTTGAVAYGLLAARGYWIYHRTDGGTNSQTYQLVPTEGRAAGGGATAPPQWQASGKFDPKDTGGSAQWMASAARAAGIPDVLPVMAWLQARTNQTGPRTIFGLGTGTKDPGAALHEFLQRAAGSTYRTNDPNQYGAWIAGIVFGTSVMAGMYQRWYQTARNLVQMSPKPLETPHGGGGGIQVRATAYNGAEPGGGGFTTATGTKVRWGVVAVDPKVIPLGTKMNISGFGNQVFRAEDTGGAIKGNRIDIWYPSVAAARKFGVQQKIVYLLGK